MGSAKRATKATGERRAALYVRVSSEEQVEGYSLAAQERAIRAYCDFHGFAVVAEYRDEGRSARTDDLGKRPAFKRMLDDAEAGAFDAVIVHKLDRFARTLRVTLETLDLLERAGVGFVSVNENMDFATPMGRVVLSTMGSLAQFYSDNLSFETKKGKSERKRQGLYNGVVPFGAIKGEDGLPVPHPAAHPGLVLAFGLAAEGKTDREVAQALNAAGFRTTGNRGANTFTKDSVRVILQNRFYLGELPDGEGGWVAGKHEPLIDADLFTAADAARARNTRRPIRAGNAGRPWALSGVAVCACGASVVANGRPGGRRSLRCYGRAQGTGCDQPSFYEDVLDEQLAGIVGRFALPASRRSRLVAAWVREQGRRAAPAAERDGVRRKLERLRDAYLDGDLEKGEYQQRKAVLAAQLAALPSGAEPIRAVADRLAAYLADIAAAWGDATPEERNRLARQLFAEAVVDNRTVVAVRPRPVGAARLAGGRWAIWRKRRGSVQRTHLRGGVRRRRRPFVPAQGREIGARRAPRSRAFPRRIRCSAHATGVGRWPVATRPRGRGRRQP